MTIIILKKGNLLNLGAYYNKHAINDIVEFISLSLLLRLSPTLKRSLSELDVDNS